MGNREPPPSGSPRPRRFQSQKIGSPHFVAAGGRNILYGLWRNLWHRRHRSRRRIRPRDPHPSAHSHSLEPADSLHDRRAVERSALRGRLLRLGAPRYGQLLGIPGGLALAGGLDLRHGHLPHAVRPLSESSVPLVRQGHRGLMVGVAVVAVCALLNIAGVRVVSTTSLWLFFALSAPFALMVFLSPFKFGALAHAVTKPTTSTVDILGGLLICMWNYMGWDNASTIATEVERPQRTYPRAMLAAVGIVGLTYILPVAAVWLTGLAPTAWETGSWADIAGMLGGPLLRIALVLGGMMSGFGMFNALVMSY